MIGKLDPSRFQPIVFCPARYLKRISQSVRRNDVKIVPFRGRFDQVAAGHYTEQLAMLPTFPTWQERQRRRKPITRSTFGLPDAVALYFCPHRLPKYHPNFDAYLRGILEQDLSGHLVLLCGTLPGAQAALQRRLARNLGDSLCRRIHFMPVMAVDRYLAMNILRNTKWTLKARKEEITRAKRHKLRLQLERLDTRAQASASLLGAVWGMLISDAFGRDSEENPLALSNFLQNESAKIASESSIAAQVAAPDIEPKHVIEPKPAFASQSFFETRARCANHRRRIHGCVHPVGLRRGSQDADRLGRNATRNTADRESVRARLPER